ncbi:hypothetical protein C9374_007890 [Naegleria lovaniensis]|uniref:Uncharacterized protein n=1 Tax=Naegleria lovaniensis TaxID=51637 RepID=A0AA88GFY5_NAELO|nr:uncharacterized protein C9374_007890 [Naegleria lovaniensis]KAG2378742.1 hypothetical protein C9374_007890 [Naegleria lovaniensis]
MQCDDDSEFLINNSKNKKNPGIFSFLLQHGMKDLFLTYFLPDFFSPQEIIQIFCSHHASNRALRKEILTCESLWDLQFKYLFPTLYEMKNQILNSQWWTSQREEQLNQLVDESRDVFIFSSDGQSLIPLDQHEEYTKEMIRISCRNEVMSLVFGMMIDHAFYETNFYENDNITSTHYAKNFVLLRFFYLMIKSNRLLDTTTRYEGLSIHKIMQNNFMKQQQQQRIPPRFHMMDYFKIYESLLVDMIFKSNMPLAAYSLLKFGWSDACDDEKIPSDETTYYLPYIDFSYGDRRSYYNRFFQIHPFVKLNE